MPSDVLNERIQEDNVPYDIWVEKEYITLTEGSQNDFSLVTQWFRSMIGKYDIRPLWVGYDLQNAPLIKQVTEIVLGAVFGAPAGAFITFDLIQRGIISAKFSRVKVTALLRDMVLTGLALVAIDLLFSWVTNINNFNLMQALFSWKIIGEFVSGVLIVLLI